MKHTFSGSGSGSGSLPEAGGGPNPHCCHPRTHARGGAEGVQPNLHRATRAHSACRGVPLAVASGTQASGSNVAVSELRAWVSTQKQP